MARGLAFRHIIDLDGQLAGIDDALVDTATLLARTGRPSNRRLFLVRPDGRVPIGPREMIRLSEDEVLFFESAVAPRQIAWPSYVANTFAA